MSNYPESKPTFREVNVYSWPIGMPPLDEADEVDRAFYPFAFAVKKELTPVYEFMYEPMPDDPTLLDEKVTNDVEGWMPRVAALMVRAEWFLNRAKRTKWPAKFTGADGKPATEADRTSIYYDALADYRFVRDELETLLARMVDRMRWAQSVRKVHADAQ